MRSYRSKKPRQKEAEEEGSSPIPLPFSFFPFLSSRME